jgi:hypothetical protein
MKRRTAQPTVEITIEQAFALSARVHRELGGYFKDTDIPVTGGAVSNKTQLSQYLLANADVTDADRARGLELLAHCRGLIMKKLANDINQYDSVILEVANRTTITDADRYHLALLASVPQTVARVEQRRQQDEKIADRAESYLAQVGAKVVTDIEVLRSTFSNNYNVFFTMAKTDDGCVVFFAYKEQLKPGRYSIRGTVKAHRDDYQTQLNRVKVMS